jgi:two-component system OmpR family sensor kinase
MKPLPSIRRRLSHTLVGVSVAWGIAVSVALSMVTYHQVDELLDTTLQESAEILYGLLSFNAQSLPLQAGGGSMPAPAHDERTVWQIVGAEQQVLLRSHRAPEVPLLGHRTPGLSRVGEAWHVYGIPFDDKGAMLYVAQRGGERRAARMGALLITAGAALGVGLLCALWLRARVSKELEPVFAMSSAVQGFDPMHPDATLAQASRMELVPVVEAIRDLGTRLSERIASERAFSAHAAHALRTPLAGMVMQLAVAQRKAPPEVQIYLARSREAADRLQRVVTALLTLFRTGAEVRWGPVRVADLIAYLPVIELAVDTEGDTTLCGDPDLLGAALMNIVDNSLRHSAARVTLSARSDPDGGCIVIRDNGTGLPESRRAALQAALAVQAYEGQMGLGLMLADLVARAHGGRLQLQSTDVGCVVEIRLGPAPRAGSEAGA